MFYNNKQFPFTKDLEANWKAILEEYKKINPEKILKAPWEHLYKNTWDMYPIFRKGFVYSKECAEAFPVTIKLLESIPGCAQAAFFILGPHEHVTPHVGYTHELLRCHLGLIIPENCGIRVANETRTWEEGKCIVFNDMLEHEVWNRSDTARVILLVDVLKSSYDP